MPEGTNVEKNILQMIFDNSKFDKNIAKSQKSIEDFKQAMDFDETSRGLERFSEAANHNLNFEGLISNIDALTNKFTGLGDAGEYVISRIRAAFEDAAKYVESFAKSLSIDQIDVGQSKYDALNKAVMTITASGEIAEEKAYSVFERLMTYTNETSYSFADMVHYISAFNAAGLDLNSSEKAMEGIANATAKAGQGVAQASAAMGVFSKAMGAGFLNKNQWDSLNLTAHMITKEFRQTLADAAVAAGTLQKVGDEYRVAEAYRSDAARNAKDELARAQADYNKKKSDANAKKVENLQRKVAQYEQNMTISVQNLENSLHNKWLTSEVLMNALQQYYFEDIDNPDADWSTFAGQAAKAAQRAMSLTDAINAMKEAVSAGWMDSFRLFWGDLSESMETFTNIANRVIEIIDRLKGWRNGILEVWALNGGRDSFVKMLLGDYEKDLKEGVTGFIDLIEDLGDFVAESFYDFIKLFMPEEMRQNWDDPGFKEAWFSGVLYNLTEGVSKFFTSIKEFFNGEVVTGTGEIKTRLQVFHDIIKGIVAVFKLGYDMVTSIIQFLSEVAVQLQPSFDAITMFFSELGLALYGTAEDAEDSKALPTFFHELAEEFRPLTEGINDLVIAFTEMLGIIVGIDDEKGGTRKVIAGIGDAIKGIANVISSFGVPILKFFTTFIEVISDLIQNGFNAETLSAAGQAIADALKTLLSEILGAFPDDGGVIGQAIKDLFGLNDSDSEEVSNSIFTFIHNTFTMAFERIKAFLASLFGGFNLGAIIKSGFGIGSARNFISTVVKWFKNVNLYSVIMAFLGVATLTQFFRLLTNANKAVTGVRNFFVGIGDSLKNGFKLKIADSDFADQMFKIAEAIGIFVLSIVALGSLPLGALAQGIIAVGVIMGAVVAFNYFIKKSGKDMKITEQVGLAADLVSLASVILAISVGLSLLSLAILPLANDPVKMLTAVLGITAMLAALGGFLYLMITAIMKLSEKVTMLQTKNSLFMRSSNGLGKLSLLLLALGGSILLITAGLSVLMLAIVPFVNTGWEGLARGLLGILGILAILGGFLYLMSSQAANSKWGDLGKGTVSMLGLAFGMASFAAAIALLVIALLPLAAVSWEGFAKMFAGLGAILLLLGGFILAINKFAETTKSKKMGSSLLGSFMEEKETKQLTARIKGLAGLAISIGILVLALTPLSNMSWEGWGKSMLGLLAILTMLGGFMVAMKHFELESIKIAGIIGFVVSIAILAFALKSIATMGWEGLAVSLTGLFGILVLLGGFMSFVKSQEIEGVKLAGLLVFVASIWILTQAMIPIASLDFTQLIIGIVGLAAVMTLVAGFVLIMNDMKADLKSAGVAFVLIIALAALMVVFSLVLNDVRNVPWEIIAAFSVGLSAMVIAMAGALLIVSKLPIGGALKGILILSAGIAAILTVISALIPMILGAIGTGMADAGGKLKVASGTIADFVERINAISDSDTDHAKSVVEKLKDILASAASFGGLGDKIKGFTLALYDLGTGLQIFQSHISMLNGSGAIEAIVLIQQLSSCADGLERVSRINLSGFTAGLQGLGGAMGIYAMGATEVAELDPNKAPDVGNAIAILEALSQGLIEHGGFAIPEDLPSEEALGTFGAQLAALAMAMVKFEEAGSQLGTGTAQALASLDFLTEIKGRLTSMGAINEIVNFFTGQEVTADVMTQFGLDIERLGIALASFSNSTTVVDEKTKQIKPLDFTMALRTLNSFVKLKEKLPTNDPTWVQWITGTKENFNTLAGEIESAGTALADFSSKANEAVGTEEKRTAMNNALSALQKIVDFINRISNRMPKIGGAKKKLEDAINGHKKTIEEIATEMTELAGGLASIAAAIPTTPISDESVKNALSVLQSVIDFMDKVREGAPDVGGAKAAFDTFINGHKKSILDISTDVTSISEAMQAVTNAIPANPINEENRKSVLSALKSVIIFAENITKDTTTNVGGVKDAFHTFIEGRKKNIDDIKKDVASIGEALDALQKAIPANPVSSDAVTQAVDALESVVTFVSNLTDRMPNVGGVKAVWDTVWNGQKQNVKDLGTGIAELGTSLSAFGTEISGKFQDTVNVQNAMYVVESYAGLVQALAAFDDAYGFGPDMVVKARDLLDLVRYLANGISSDELMGGEARLGIVDSMVSIMDNISKRVAELGGVDGSAIAAFRDLAQAILFVSQINVENDFKPIGLYIVQGVATGIKDNVTIVNTAAKNMAIEAFNAAMKALEAGSPSRLFMEVGSFVPAGMAIGIDNGTAGVVKSIEGMSDEAYAAAGTLITEMSRIMAEDINANPTISPVLDMTNIAEGIHSINGTGVTLNAIGSVKNVGGIGSHSIYEENQNGIDLNGIYDRMANLSKNIVDMGEQIKNLKLILDTGALVGGISDGIDKQLGRNQFYAGRRNM